MVIPVAHDFSCGWCWIGVSQMRRLRQAFPDVQFEFIGYELFPESMEWPAPEPDITRNPNKPRTPSRFQLAMAAEGLPRLTGFRPPHMRTTLAHQALELAKENGCAEEVLEKLYEAHWLDGEDISDTATLHRLLADTFNFEELENVFATRPFADRVIPFDDQAFESGVYNVPTFFIGGERYAEQPYYVLHEAIEKCMIKSNSPT